MNYWNRQKGLALPAVIGVMVILMLLGTALWHSGMADARQSKRLEQRVQAEYIARSGAKAYAEYLIKEFDSLEELENSDFFDATSDATELGKGFFTVTVKKSPMGEYYVRSEGTVGNVSHEARLSITRQSAFGDVALFGKTLLLKDPDGDDNDDDLPILQIGEGGAYTAMTKEEFISAMGWGDKSDEAIENLLKEIFVGASPDEDAPIGWADERTFEDPGFPDPVEEGYELFEGVPGGRPPRVGIIEKDSYADEVSLAGNEALLVRFANGGGDPPIINLVVDTFKGVGNAQIRLEGKGTFILWVRDTMDFMGTFSSTVNWDESEIIINVAGDGVGEPGVQIGGTATMHGRIYAPNRNVKLHGTPLVQGSIIGDLVEIYGRGAREKLIYQKRSDEISETQLFPGIGSWLR